VAATNIKATPLSRTAVWALAARAIGARDPDPTVRNPDWLAERLLGDNERALLAGSPLLDSLAQPYAAALLNRETSTAVRAMLQRTHFIDEHVEQAVRSGIGQIVLLGAGFDSRAVRLGPLLRGVRIFEVDQPRTQEYKRSRLADVLGRQPDDVIYVPLDLRDELAAVLGKYTYDSTVQTMFIVEGVTMYLPEKAAVKMFETIARVAPAGSRLAFDYWTRRHVDELPRVDEGTRIRRELLERWGEPVLFGVPDDGRQSFFERLGLRIADELPMFSGAAVERYLTRADGSRVGNTPWPPAPPPIGTYGAWLAQAIVEEA
jgi:methyltransferase (TIGR00027 family)